MSSEDCSLAHLLKLNYELRHVPAKDLDDGRLCEDVGNVSASGNVNGNDKLLSDSLEDELIAQVYVLGATVVDGIQRQRHRSLVVHIEGDGVVELDLELGEKTSKPHALLDGLHHGHDLCLAGR